MAAPMDVIKYPKIMHLLIIQWHFADNNKFE
jgi:hypothetical protein